LLTVDINRIARVDGIKKRTIKVLSILVIND
jgi:hypothetical protein